MKNRHQEGSSASSSKIGVLAMLSRVFGGDGSGTPTGRGAAPEPHTGVVCVHRRPPSTLMVIAWLGLAAVLCLLLWAPDASAAHVQLGTIGEPCPAGEVPCGPGKLKEPSGVAVNEATHDVYVVDKGNDRVVRFSSSGAVLGEFDGSGLLPGEEHAAGSLGREEAGEPIELETGRFQEPEGIAVDNSCTLQDPPLTESTTPTCAEFDPSYGDVYVADAGEREGTKTSHPVVDKFSANGEYLGQIIRNVTGEEFSKSGFHELYGVAVDPAGKPWVFHHNFGSPPRQVADYTNAQPNVAIASRNVDIGPGAGPPFAVDAEDSLYVGHGTPRHLLKFSSAGGETGEFGVPPASGVAVELTNDHVYVDNETTLRAYTPGEVELESLPVPGGHGTGVGVDASTANGSTLYVADSSTDLVYVYPPEPPGPPTIEATSVSAVTGQSATLEGEINPRSEPGEAPTTYRLEYGPCVGGILGCAAAPYPSVVPGQIPASFESTAVSAVVGGLVPDSAYHLRITATNEHEGHANTTVGEDRTFVTQGAATGLPDHRGYELVSQPDKQGSLLFPITFSGLVQASASGEAITYLANGPTEPAPPGNSQAVQVLSRRAGSATSPWLSADIATPHPGTVGVSVGGGQGEYRFFSPDLSRALIQPFGPFTALSPEASEQTPYLRTNFPEGQVGSPCTTGCYRALVSAANVPPGTEFARKAKSEGGPCREHCAPWILGASTDAEHVVLESSAPLTEDAPPAGSHAVELYEWSAGRLQLLSVLPTAEGGGPVAPGSIAVLGYHDPTSSGVQLTRGAISADGSRVVFSEQSGNNHLYLRDTTADAGAGETVRLDLPQAGASGEGRVEPIFQDASADGSRIFFTDTQQLVEGASGSGADLYECHLVGDPGGPGCELTDLTSQGSGGAAGVLGQIAGDSADGSSVYFVANGVLGATGAEGAVPGSCIGLGPIVIQPASADCNLYLRRDGRTRLVAVLSGQDFPDWGLRGGGLAGLTDRVSSDGRYLAFMSRRPLTGYDNRDAASGERDEEIFLYDADAGSGAGRLVCASCDPSGARPHGVEYRRINTSNPSNPGLAGGSEIWPNSAWIAAAIPGWTPISEAGEALYQSRYLSDQGRLFFNSADALVPGDSNGTMDVYQYEPPQGEGAPPADTCNTSSATYSQTSGGCVDLISSGTSGEESAFMDASESGDDVFFLTASRLSPRDADTATDLYDARVGGGEEEAAKPVECSGDACQQPAAGRNHLTPGSLTFQGPGNVVECPKGKKLRKGRCVKPKARHHKKHHKKNGKGKKSKKSAGDPKRGKGR